MTLLKNPVENLLNDGYKSVATDDEMRKEVLGEVLMDELKAIGKYVQDISGIKMTLKQMDGRLGNIETGITAVKALLYVHNDAIRLLKEKVA
jgi:hypothetical protein